ncbi:MAG: translation elongation factor Ts, partial [Lachnospiraceae bacterium]|nr:translation elongation factor Ts [Lachnospiraceae bacterium]
ELREATGCGMIDCKKALTETQGDFDKAVEFLRKKGLAGAEKKAGRIAAEGISLTSVSSDGKSGVVVEVNSETDFVAKNEKFRGYVKDVCDQALASTSKDMDSFLSEKWAKDSTKTVKEELSSQISIIGENLIIRRKDKLENPNGLVYDYVHGGGRIGVLVSIDTNVVNDEVKEMAKHVAMQIASMRPKFVDVMKAVEGGLNKELKEICLNNQVYIMAEDGKQSVSQYVESVAKAQNASIKVVKFVRYETGEGLEKRQDDFAAEVAKQMGM